MNTAMDGTIKQAIIKQSGLGLYLYVVVWDDGGEQSYTAFSFWDDAAIFRQQVEVNGHKVVNIVLCVDRSHRLVSDAGEIEP